MPGPGRPQPIVSLRPQRILPLLAFLAAACSDAPAGPTAPGLPGPGGGPPMELPAEAFPLTIDVTTGEVRVGTKPAADDDSPYGLSNALLDDKIAGLEATPCTFSPVSGNKKLIRCTFDIRITNLLSRTELVTPTSFPRPPAGTDGILVFPLLSGAIGSPGGAAVASPDWDGEPINFFNSFDGCGRGSDDCYRWERFDAPLAPGATSEWRTVGFDVPKSAQSVGVHVIVAADLRDNPEYEVTLDPISDLTGEVREVSGVSKVSIMRAGRILTGFLTYEQIAAVATFDLGSIPANARIRSAWLTVQVQAVVGGVGEVVVHRIDVGETLDTRDAWSAVLEPVGLFSPTEPGPIEASAVDAVQGAVDAGSPTAAFRFFWVGTTLNGAWVAIQRTADDPTLAAPQLRVVYGYD